MTANTLEPSPATDASGAGLNAATLLDAIIEKAGLQPHQVAPLLGVDRHNPSILKIERAVTAQRVLSNRELLEIKTRLSGFLPVDDDMFPTTEVGSDNARKAAALTLTGTDGRAQLAMVDPDSRRIAALVPVIRKDPAEIDVRVATLEQMTSWISAINHYRAYDPDVPIEVAQGRPLPDVWVLIDELVNSGGSDLHLLPNEPPVIRVDGDLRRLQYEPATVTWLTQAFQDLAGRDLTEELEGHTNLNIALRFGTRRVRLVIARSDAGPTLVARLLSERIPAPEQIHLPVAVRDWADLHAGLVLVTGVTGSGKSTTLAALLARMAERHRRKIITLEDPIEFHLPGSRSVIDQRQLHTDFADFPTAIATVLRQDPDVILVGEMRDAETIHAAVEAADTGHLVLSTLHTADAASSISRIIDFFPSEQQPSVRSKLAYILRGIVSQTLMKRSSGGRIAAYEVLQNTTAIRNLLENPEQMKQIGSFMASARQDGMSTMDQSLAELVKARQVEREVAAAKATNLDQFISYLGD